MAFGAKTNERPGTRAQARYIRMSPSKAREVLDLIRGRSVAEATDILALVERDAAQVIAKVLDSAVANAVANDDQDPDRLFVSACFADEGPTLKRFRPRARGRATTIRKRTTHITVIVTRMTDEQVARAEAAEAASPGGGRQRRVSASRAARVAKSRQSDAEKAGLDVDDASSGADTASDDEAVDVTEPIESDLDETADTDEAADDTEAADEVATDEVATDEAEAEGGADDATATGEAATDEAATDEDSSTETKETD